MTKKQMLGPSVDVVDDAFVVEEWNPQGIRGWNVFLGSGKVIGDAFGW